MHLNRFPINLDRGCVYIVPAYNSQECFKKSLENEGEDLVAVKFLFSFYIHVHEFQLIRHSPSPEVFILCSLCPLTISKNVEITKIVWKTRGKALDCSVVVL